MGERPKSAPRKWNAGLSTPEALRTAPLDFRVSQQNVIVYADRWSSGECRFKPIRLTVRKGLPWLVKVFWLSCLSA